MAKGRKTGGRDFKPGVSGNPKGGPKLPTDLKEMRNLTKTQFESMASKYIGMTKEELLAAARDPSTKVLELMVASIVSKAVAEGDEKRLNFLLDRMIGKVPTPVMATVDPELVETIKSLEGKSTEELLAIINKKPQ